MNVVILSQSYYVRNSFIGALIPRGILLYHVEHKDHLIEAIQKHEADVVVLDVIQEDFNDIFVLMREVKSHTSEIVKKAAIILLIGAIDKQNVTRAVNQGAIGFIKSNTSEDVIGAYIIDIYQKIKGAPPERKYVRVSLDVSNHNDRIGIKMRSPINSQLIMGVIKDISFGGLAIELVGTFAADSLATGVEIKNMQFIIDSKDVFVDGVVVAYKQNFLAIRFVNMPVQEREIISQFVFQRMSAIAKAEEKAAAEARAAQEKEAKKAEEAAAAEMKSNP